METEAQIQRRDMSNMQKKGRWHGEMVGGMGMGMSARGLQANSCRKLMVRHAATAKTMASNRSNSCTPTKPKAKKRKIRGKTKEKAINGRAKGVGDTMGLAKQSQTPASRHIEGCRTVASDQQLYI